MSCKKEKKLKKKNEKKEKSLSSINLIDNRIIYLDGEIDDNTAEDVINKLLRLDIQSHKDIIMCINSKGGSVSAGFAIYDAMNMIKSRVITVCIGKCLSMASVLLVNGEKGKRFILPNAEVMIHEVSSISVGKVGEMKNLLDHSKNINDKLFKILVDKSNISYKQIKKNATGKDWWINSNDSLQYGIVDKVISQFSEILKI